MNGGLRGKGSAGTVSGGRDPETGFDARRGGGEIWPRKAVIDRPRGGLLSSTAWYCRRRGDTVPEDRRLAGDVLRMPRCGLVAVSDVETARR